MKLLLLIPAFLMGFAAPILAQDRDGEKLETSVINPGRLLLSRKYGDSRDSLWTECRVHEKAVLSIYRSHHPRIGVPRPEEKAKTNIYEVDNTRFVDIAKAYPKMADWISEAARERVDVAHHIRETRPVKNDQMYTVTRPPANPAQVLFFDGSDTQTRRGDAAQELLAVLSRECGTNRSVGNLPRPRDAKEEE